MNKPFPGKLHQDTIGDIREELKWVQECLGVSQTGDFDKDTRTAIRKFQRERGMDPPSGEIDEKTWFDLVEACSGKEVSAQSTPNRVIVAVFSCAKTIGPMLLPSQQNTGKWKAIVLDLSLVIVICLFTYAIVYDATHRNYIVIEKCDVPSALLSCGLSSTNLPGLLAAEINDILTPDSNDIFLRAIG